MTPAAPARSPQEIRDMFSRIAGPYDFLNRFFSLGIDRYWRHILIRTAMTSLPAGTRILDLATGSGDVALIFQKKGFDVVGADFCPPMLEMAQKKGLKQTVEADALNLPFTENSFDCCTVAFGLRNFADKPAAMKEVLRVLKPGGRFHILEFTRPREWLCGIYFYYLNHIMPRIAGLFCRDPQAYAYLARSVEAFPKVEEVEAMMRESGYGGISWKRLTMGIVAIHSGQKSG